MALKEKKNIKDKYSKDYLAHLMLKDFLGQLNADEIKIAKKNGLLEWDLWVKSKNLGISASEIEAATGHCANCAPVYDGFGNPKYPEKQYFINNYEELSAKLAEK